VPHCFEDPVEETHPHQDAAEHLSGSCGLSSAATDSSSSPARALDGLGASAGGRDDADGVCRGDMEKPARRTGGNPR